MANSKPHKAITEETKGGTKKKKSPGREVVAGNAGEKSQIFANIIGDSKNSDLLLVESQHGFEGRGIEGEVVGIASSYLNPNCSSKTNPWRSAPSFENQLRHICLSNFTSFEAILALVYYLYNCPNELKM